MKRNLYYFMCIISIIIISSCDKNQVNNCITGSEYSNSNYLSVSENDILSNGDNQSNNDDYPMDYIIPESFEVNGILYVIDRDFDKSSITTDCLIGHIIYEKDIQDYINDYPDLLPSIDNYFKCTDNKISIYTVKSNIDGQIIENYLAIQYNIENIIFTEIFRLKEEN